ncbi:MAG: tetratricopeptide repeat protein [Planctomycetota bacterium]
MGEGEAGGDGGGGGDMFREALKHYKKREDAKAIEILEELLKISPDYTEARYLLGDIHYVTKKLGHARKHFEEILKSDPASPYGPYGMALVHLIGKRFRDAETCANQAINLAKDLKPIAYQKIFSAECYYVLGMSFRHRDASGIMGASKAFKECTKLNTRHFRGWTELGIVTAKLGKSRDAYSCFRKALNVNRHYIPARFNWGITYYREGKLAESLQTLRNLTRHPDFYVEALKVIGRCYHRLGEEKRARTYYTQYLDKGGKDTRVNEWLESLRD